MKGTTVFQLVKDLPEKELGQLRAAVMSDVNGQLLVKIIDTFLKADEYDEAALLKALGTTKHKKNRLLDELGDLALRLIGSDDPEGKLMDAVVGVRKLTFQMRNEGAIHLWRWANGSRIQFEIE